MEKKIMSFNNYYNNSLESEEIYNDNFDNLMHMYTSIMEDIGIMQMDFKDIEELVGMIEFGGSY